MTIKTPYLYQLAFMVLFCFFSIETFAQKGAIIVKDEGGNALAGVYVRDLNNPGLVGITTYGKFDTRDTEFSQDILLERFGYESQTIEVDLKAPNYVTLKRKTLPEGVFYYHTFNTLDPGFRTNRYQVFGDFDTETENGLTESTSGSTETRIFIDDDEDVFGGGSSLRVRYPRGKVDSKESGVQWRGNLHSAHSELYVSYWVKFENGFDYTLGGKLPGVSGTNVSGDKEFSGKLMWRDNGKVEFYLHPTKNGVDNGTSDAGKIRGWWNKGGQVYLQKGKWEHIEIYYKLNTPGQANGIMRGWVNGELKGERKDVEFRGSGESGVLMREFFFSTFFGGNESYAPNSDLYAWYDEIVVSDRRVNEIDPIITANSSNFTTEKNVIIKTGKDTYQLIQPSEWTITDMLGRTLSSGSTFEINVSEFQAGQYILKSKNGSARIMKEL